MKKVLPVANGLALIVTIVISYLSNTGIFNGNTMATVSARYSNLFTPAGYAFSIWGLIYLGLIAFVIQQGRSLFGNPEAIDLVQRVGGWFVLSCLANSAWVLAWLDDRTGLSVLIMLLLLFSLGMIILRTDMELTDPPFRTVAWVWWPFCLYSGWISVAFFADLAAWLTKIKWEGFGMGEMARAIIMIGMAGALHLFMIWRRNMREFALVGVWALVAIGVGDRDRAGFVTTAAITMAAILLVNVGIHGYRNRATLPWRKRG